MNLFGDILDELKNSLKKKASFKEDIADVISKELNIKINSDDLVFKNGKLFINSSPTLKASILLKKERLLINLSIFGVKSIN
jgi:hypothetical protein